MVEKLFSCLDLAQLYGRPTKAVVDEPCEGDTSNFVFKCSRVAKVTLFQNAVNLDLLLKESLDYSGF